MNQVPDAAVIRSAADITTAWLSRALGQPVLGFEAEGGSGNWSQQIRLMAQLQGGAVRVLRLKLCLGNTFGRSEVDYYTVDYAGMPDAPLVKCFDARYAAGVGYHLLLEDLASTHHDHRDEPPTLAHGMALAEAMGRLHRHHWQRRPAPDHQALVRYLDEARPGLPALEQATGQRLHERMQRHEAAFLQRWSSPKGMSLLHGDLNPTNVLTPKGRDEPVYFLDRQPFDWSLTYGVAVHDLAYALVPWWPPEALRDWEQPLLRHWYDSVDMPGYTWAEAQADWALSVEQCLNVPLAWCSKPDTLGPMRWLWEAQLARVQAALDRGAPTS